MHSPRSISTCASSRRPRTRRSRLILANAWTAIMVAAFPKVRASMNISNSVETRKKSWLHKPGTIQHAQRIISTRATQEPIRVDRVAAFNANVSPKTTQEFGQALRIKEVHVVRRQHVRIRHVIAL